MNKPVWARRVRASRALIALSLPLSAATAQNQSADTTIPRTPTQCLQKRVYPAQTQVYQWMSDTNAKLVDGLPWENVQKMVDTATKNAALRCLALIRVDKTPNDELKSLSELYVWADKIEKAKSIVKRRLASAPETKDKIQVLVDAIRAFDGGSAPPLQRVANRKGYLEQLNAMGDVALIPRIHAHLEMYDQWAREPERRDKSYLTTALALYGRVTDTALKRKEARSLGALFVSLSVRALQDGDLAYADHIADSGLRVVAEFTDTATMFQLPGYGTLGQKGSPISSCNWMNAPAGFQSYQPGQGKVTLVELTSYG